MAQAAEALPLGPLLSRKPRERSGGRAVGRSGGQRQRMAIGRAVARQPGVFLVDALLPNLDAALRTQMRAELAQLHAQLGVTTVCVSHDQVQAMALADRIAVFNHGRIAQVGPPMALYQRPAHRFVAGFLGAAPMNLLPAQCEPGLPGADQVAVGQAGALAWAASPTACMAANSWRAWGCGQNTGNGCPPTPLPAAGGSAAPGVV